MFRSKGDNIRSEFGDFFADRGALTDHRAMRQSTRKIGVFIALISNKKFLESRRGIFDFNVLGFRFGELGAGRNVQGTDIIVVYVDIK